MKKIALTTLLGLTMFYTVSAQFDDKFYFPSKEWVPVTGLSFEEINFHIDNDTLNTILFKTDVSPKATIIFYHGAGGNISTNTYLAELLTNEGYQVFMTDFRGYGKSTGKPTHINIANDAQIIFDSIINRDDIKQYPVIIYGASIGTQIATKMAKDNRDRISALILDGTISSFTDIALFSAPEEQQSVISLYVTSPYSAKEDIKSVGPVPKLFIHSKEDTSVPFGMGKKVYSYATGPKEFWIYKGEHLEASQKYREEFIQRINTLYESILTKT